MYNFTYIISIVFIVALFVMQLACSYQLFVLSYSVDS